MQNKLIFILLLLLAAGQPAAAQFYPTQYRPPNQHWQQLSTDHFKILFPAGQDSAAWKTARILEKEYPKAQKLTGGHLSNFPVILNDYNDRSNGLVTSLHFRSEIDLSPIKGKSLNPKNGGWLANVVPHELTHATQFSHLGGLGLGRFVNFFSPDAARSMHGASPSGIQEGLAVYFESNAVTSGGGRGNYPFFTNQFETVSNSQDPWSMGQMVHFPTYTRPFNRHYIGGYEFTQWLQETYGTQTSRDAIDFHIRWPFLGYGVALKHATGQWPAQLYDAFSTDKAVKTLLQKKAPYQPLPLKGDGADIRRPKWLNDSTLVFYGSFYNKPPGFYRYDLPHHATQRILSTRMTSDYQYALSGDHQSLIYSYNRPHPIFPGDYKSTLVKANLTTGSTTVLNKKDRLFAPSFETDSTLLALQTDHSQRKLTHLQLQTNKLVDFTLPSAYTVKTVRVNPRHPDTLAVVANHRGNQALWTTYHSNLSDELKKAPALSFKNGSVFDPEWSPNGRRLLFSADFTGILQVYEYNIKTGSVSQITHAPYNAFEPSYSPGGHRIAFVIQRGSRRLPVVISRPNFSGKQVDGSTFHTSSLNQAGLQVKVSKKLAWEQQDYHTGFSWLKPRTFLPTVDDISGRDNAYQVGAAFYSSDLLQQQSYSAKITGAENRAWYDLTYQNKQFFPGFKARIYSEPAFRRYRFSSSTGQSFSQTFLRQERSLALSAPMQFTLAENVASTNLYIEPEIRQSQLRFFNNRGKQASDFSHTTIGRMFAQFNYRLQQNIRDVQPRSGLVFYSEVEHYLASDGLTLHTASGAADLNFQSPSALRGGLYGYLSPLQQWNQSLRLGLQGITQTAPLFDNQSIVSNGFENDIFPFTHNLVSISGRYTIPLFYPDDGGLLIPLYLSSVYLSAFSDTVLDPAQSSPFSSSSTVLGGGLRVRFRISNLPIDIGFGVGWNPARNKVNYFVGDF